jgi:predicted transposase YdaD
MKRDSIYYQIFKRFPGLLFELIDYRPEQAQNYRFESVEVKETAFRIDGVVLKSFVEGNLPHKLFAFYLQKAQHLKLYFLLKCNFRKTNLCIIAFLPNR